MVVGVVVSLGMVMGVLGGCAGINADRRLSAEAQAVTGATDGDAGLAAAGRGWPPAQALYPSVELTHPTVYMSDPFERHGSDDGRFRTWCLDDVVSLAVSPAAFLGKIIALPVTAVSRPPWQMHHDRSTFAVEPAAFELPGAASGMTRCDDADVGADGADDQEQPRPTCER